MRRKKIITVSKQTTFSLLRMTALVAASTLMLISNAFAAKDDLQIKIISSTPEFVAISNDIDLDTYTSNPITLDFSLVDTSFPEGVTAFGTVQVGMNIVDKSGAQPQNQSTEYPLTVNLVQQGGGNQDLLLTASPNSFPRNAAGEFGTSDVTVTLNCTEGKCDGKEQLEATLQFNGPGGNDGLNSSVNLTVRISLVPPPETACLGVKSFVTNQGRNTVVDTTEVVTVRAGKNAGKVNTTVPFGQHSYNVLVANICGETDSFDLKITLDPSYETNPSNNPGNAVFTYLLGGMVDIEDFAIESFFNKTPQGQTLCLEDVELIGEHTSLTTVHMGVKRGVLQEELTGFGGEQKFSFTAEIFAPGTGCLAEDLEPEATDTAEVSYTIK
jgi:hypothetical protein